MEEKNLHRGRRRLNLAAPVNFLRKLGPKIPGAWLFSMFISSAGLMFDTCYGSLRKGRSSNLSLTSQINRQILYTGVEAFGLVGMIAFLCGSAIIWVAMLNMPKLGVSEYFGKILVIVVAGELGPFVTSLVVVGRSGSALATYIGTMRVNKEVEALEVMGIDPAQFLVLPALVGIVCSIICLNIYFISIAIFGGLTVAKFMLDIPFGVFLSNVLDELMFKDVFFTVLKSVVFGFIVALVSSHCGLGVKNIRMIPVAAIQAVVGSMFITILFNLFLSFAYYVL